MLFVQFSSYKPWLVGYKSLDFFKKQQNLSQYAHKSRV
jgi:hypothetical protein